MPTKNRKIEVHRLTISGLPAGTGYAAFLSQIRESIVGLKDCCWDHGGKTHGLHEAKVLNHRLRLLAFSFQEGHRPDVLDTEQFSIEPTPLAETQTGIEWTHILGGLVGKRFLLLVEKVQSGIHPSTLEHYLQWLIDEHYVVPVNTADQDPITVSLEAEPGNEFITRMDALDRITKATVRTVRPNPGWHDLEKELGEEAAESDAHKTDVQMTARRNESLSKRKGIVAAIRNLFSSKSLGFAAVEGKRGKETDSFTTEKLGRHATLSFPLDAQGQVRHHDAWHKLGEMLDKQD